MAILRIRDKDGNIQEILAIKGADGQPGKDGNPGKDGADGAPGADGYTPQKGLDYYTEEDKAEMVSEVIAQTKSVSYNSIEDALNDQNRVTDGKVSTYIVGDSLNIILLEDITSATTININKDCTLYLNGKKLSFTASGAYLNINTADKVTINGEVEGSKIIKSGITGGSATECLVYTTGTHLFILGGTYVMLDVNAKVAAIRTSVGTHIDMENCVVNIHTVDGERVRALECDFANVKNCTIDCVSDNSLGAYGVVLFAESNFENCKISAKSYAKMAQVAAVQINKGITATFNNCHIEADGWSDVEDENGAWVMKSVSAIHSLNDSSVIINGGYYWGAREGMNINGMCRINGGVFEGCQHGGAYLGSPDTRAKNAIFRNIIYAGEVGTEQRSHYGPLYCGSSSNNDVNVYLDNCRFESNCYAAHGIVAKETNTEVFLSNCLFDGNFGNDLRADKTCTIYVGKNVAYETIGVPVDPDNATSYHGTIDTTTYANQEFGFETEPTNYENLIYIKTAPLQDKLESSVLCTPQTLTPKQKAQARENVGATTLEEVLAALPIAEGVKY